MKLRITALLLAVLLFLTGCGPQPAGSEQPQQNKPQQNKPQQENNQELPPEQTARDYDLGTTVDNLLSGGSFAMANDFVYIDLIRYIVEYDMLTGTSVEIPMPDGGGDLTVRMSNGNSTGNLFLLEDGPMFTMLTIKKVIKRDSLGKYESEQKTRMVQLAQLSLDGKEPVFFPEFGERIFDMIPIRKENTGETAQSAGNNPFAGFDFYIKTAYDTFPEAAANLALDGITLEEPKDENERNKYYITALFHIDGDTMEKTMLTRDVQNFYVTQTHIYYSTNTMDGVVAGIPDAMYVSDRHEINFQPVDPALPTIGFQQGPDGLYFLDFASQRFCRYQDGVITETAVADTGDFWRIWQDQIICSVPELSWFGCYEQPWMELWTYDLETGEGRQLCDHAVEGKVFQILQDRYLAYQEYYWEYDAYVLLDLETGERIEMYRADRTAEETTKEKENFERLYKKQEERYKEMQESSQP